MAVIKVDDTLKPLVIPVHVYDTDALDFFSPRGSQLKWPHINQNQRPERGREKKKDTEPQSIHIFDYTRMGKTSQKILEEIP